MKRKSQKLIAEKRGVLGRKVKKLRQAGLVPSTLYGKGMESVSIQMKTFDIIKIFEKTGESGLVDLMLDKNKALPVLLRNPQYDVVSDDLIHIDCYKVNLDEKIVASVPIVLIGESNSVREGNILVEVTNELEMEALPADLPEKIEVDLAVLKTVSDTIIVADLKVDDKVEIKNSADQLIVKTEEPKEEEVIEDVVAPGEVPATEQKEGEEGEDEGGAEGEKKTGEGEGEEKQGEEDKKEGAGEGDKKEDGKSGA